MLSEPCPALKTKMGNIEVKRMFGKYFSAGHAYNEAKRNLQKFAILFLKVIFYQNFINFKPGLFRKVIPVIR